MNNRLQQLLEFHAGNPEDPFLQYAIALEYIKSGDQASGLQYFERLLQQAPEYIGTYYQLAKLYHSNGRKDDALQCLAQGISMARKLNDQHTLAELINLKTNIELGLDDES